MTTFRTTLVALVATLGLTLGLTVAATATASTASAASKPTLKKLPAKVKLQVKSRATLYDSRTGKVVRDRHDRAKRLSRGTVKVYTHRARIKGREYRRIAGKRYLVRLSSLRAVPKPVVRRPVVKPAPKPAPAKPKPPVVKPTTPPPTPQPEPDPKPVPYPTAVRGPHNTEALTLIFGDSNSDPSGLVDEDGAPNQAWWSSLKRATGTQLHVKAHGGSGFVNNGCWWGPFGGWLSMVDEIKPDFILIPGGRNDFKRCWEDVPKAEARAEILAYFDALAVKADANGIPRENIYTFSIWGPGGVEELRPNIVTAMRDGAEANGFSYVEVDPLAEGYSTDGIHPTADGHRLIATQFLQRSDYAQRLAAWTPPAV